jgi:hypothetical protein
MSASDKPLAPHVFSFAGGHSLQVECRRLPAEVARVTQTLQLDVEELFANLLDWGGGSEPQAQASPVNDAAANGCSGDPHLPQPQQPHSDPQREQQLGSKQLCGNVANDAPDLIGLDIWPASIALCRYLAAHPHLVARQHVLELGAGRCGVQVTCRIAWHLAVTANLIRCLSACPFAAWCRHGPAWPAQRQPGCGLSAAD